MTRNTQARYVNIFAGRTGHCRCYAGDLARFTRAGLRDEEFPAIGNHSSARHVFSIEAEPDGRIVVGSTVPVADDRKPVDCGAPPAGLPCSHPAVETHRRVHLALSITPTR
jgi:hypothetical protein